MNVRGLAEIGKRMNIERGAEKYCIDVVCATETHYPHSSVDSVPDGMYVEKEKSEGVENGFSAQDSIPQTRKNFKRQRKQVAGQQRQYRNRRENTTG